MDTRVIVDLPRVPDLSEIPELAGIGQLRPSLPPTGPVLQQAPVSLVVPTFFNSELKRRSLRQMLLHIADSRAVSEVVFVVTDGEGKSFEDLTPLLRGLPVVVVESPPHNRAASRNAGAEAARGEYLLFLDDDMVPRHWRSIDVMLSHLMSQGYDCALFPRRQYVRFPLLYDAWHLDRTVQYWREGGWDDDPFLWDPIRDGSRDLPMVFCFPGCFTLIKKSAFQQLRGFDPQYVGWGFEDTDFALRAVRDLRVLNLFRKSDPFLHIDHPVSPYKSEEHRANSKKYFSSPGAIDLHRFCRSVYQGEDFVEPNQSMAARDTHLKPFYQLKQKHVPVAPETMTDWARSVADRLITQFARPEPEFVVLHGSRARARHRPESDYDVLCLYRGWVQDFFATRTEPNVEIECASLRVFTQLADEPWLYDSRGVLDLAKIAQSQLLIGPPEAWIEWRTNLIQTAATQGRAFWLVLAVGLLLKAAKVGPALDRYLNGLRQILEAAGFKADVEALEWTSPSRLRAMATDALDQAHPDWRDRLRHHIKVFPLQVPEVWSALHHLDELAGRAATERDAIPRHQEPGYAAEPPNGGSSPTSEWPGLFGASRERALNGPAPEAPRAEAEAGGDRATDREHRVVPAKKRYVLAACSSGLSNRLTVWAGAQRVADRTGRELLLYWPKNEQVGCPFHHLFANDCRVVGAQDLHYMLGTSVTMKVYNTWRTRGPRADELAADGDPDAEIVLIKSWYYPKFANETYDREFFESAAPYLRHVQPRPELLLKAKSFPLPRPCVGIHVRREESCSEFSRSRDEHFVAIMEGLMTEEPAIGFFVASNDRATEERFQERFGDRVRVFPKNGGGRHCEPGMEESLVDLLLLSRTQGVIGTHYSSFSHVAAALGDVPHVTAETRSASEELDRTLQILSNGRRKPTDSAWRASG